MIGNTIQTFAEKVALKIRLAHQAVWAPSATLLILFTLQGCVTNSPYENKEELSELNPIALNGKWVLETNGNTMLNPQTSGLIANDEGWWSISDASADDSQIQRLHLIDKQSASIARKFGPMQLSERIQKSCFAAYLAAEPDYEAIVSNPLKDKSWILVTEDATRGAALSPSCANRFSKTGSTEHPTLLVEITMEGEQLIVSGVRALQFDNNDQVGNFPNDGFEALAFGRNNRLFLGLEKDANSQPRVFYIDIYRDFFDLTDTFIRATDAKLKLPVFKQGNHPINGMDIYFPDTESQGFLIAAARNDEELWIIDLSKKHNTKIVPLSFFAPSTSAQCPEYHKMDNASLEGVAVDGDTLVMINDPWKANYMKNAVCEADGAIYERFSPLIFTLSIPSTWFQP